MLGYLHQALCKTGVAMTDIKRNLGPNMVILRPKELGQSIRYAFGGRGALLPHIATNRETLNRGWQNMETLRRITSKEPAAND